MSKVMKLSLILVCLVFAVAVDAGLLSLGLGNGYLTIKFSTDVLALHSSAILGCCIGGVGGAIIQEWMKTS